MDRDEVEVMKLKKKKKKRANIQPSWLNKLGQEKIYDTEKKFRYNKNQEWLVYFESRERSRTVFVSQKTLKVRLMLSLF